MLLTSKRWLYHKLPNRHFFLLMEYTQQEQQVFSFLDALQRTGVTNMFGATPYIQDEFSELSKKESMDLLGRWMDTYDDRHPE